jgi:predicted SPOUT superfamily RNA methylase MTH1
MSKKMDIDEFLEYLEANSSAKDTFLEKATEYLEDKNAARERKSRWSESKIEAEAEKMWLSVVSNLYKSLRSVVKSRDNADKWIDFIEKNGVFDGFAEGIDDMEFE